MVRSIVLTLLVGVTAAGAPARARDAAARSWVRLDTGREILVIGEVERDGGLVVFRTAAGVLASISESRVVAVESVDPEGPTSDALPDERPPRTVTDVPVFTNDDLPTAPLPWRATFDRAPGSPAAAAADEVETAPLTYATYLDRNGNDEQWWRERAADLNAERDDAREEYRIWSERYRSLSDLVALECVGRRFARYLPAVCADYVRLQRDAGQRAEDARAWRDDVDAERRNLSDEARRAGALPGWLR